MFLCAAIDGLPSSYVQSVFASCLLSAKSRAGTRAAVAVAGLRRSGVLAASTARELRKRTCLPARTQRLQNAEAAASGFSLLQPDQPTRRGRSDTIRASLLFFYSTAFCLLVPLLLFCLTAFAIHIKAQPWPQQHTQRVRAVARASRRVT